MGGLFCLLFRGRVTALSRGRRNRCFFGRRRNGVTLFCIPGSGGAQHLHNPSYGPFCRLCVDHLRQPCFFRTDKSREQPHAFCPCLALCIVPASRYLHYVLQLRHRFFGFPLQQPCAAPYPLPYPFHEHLPLRSAHIVNPFKVFPVCYLLYHIVLN